MEILINAQQVRVLGVLIEKQRTTPEQYPLSLNGLTAACNQKTNREPVMNLRERDVRDALDALQEAKLVREHAGARVSRYAHRLNDALGLRFDFSDAQLGALCVLMLRGPQTPGEIKNRAGRLYEFADIEAVERTLIGLADGNRGPYVVKLAREPGHKEARYAHLLCGPVSEAVAPIEPAARIEPAAGAGAAPPASDGVAPAGHSALEKRLEELELAHLELSEAHAALRARLDELESIVVAYTGEIVKT